MRVQAHVTTRFHAAWASRVPTLQHNRNLNHNLNHDLNHKFESQKMLHDILSLCCHTIEIFAFLHNWKGTCSLTLGWMVTPMLGVTASDTPEKHFIRFQRVPSIISNAFNVAWCKTAPKFVLDIHGSSLQHSTFNMQYSIFNMQYSVFNP